MWRAWKNSPAVKENPDLLQEVREQVERSASRSPDIQFPDFDGEEFVNESEETMDSKQRVAVIITDGHDVLVGKSPQNRFKEFACCDLMKGHAQVGEGLEEAALREVQEECGLRLTNLKKISSELKYSKGTTLTFFVSHMEKLPDPNSLECQSFYEYNGKQYPEIAQYLAVPIDELPTYLYKGLAKLIVDNGLLELVGGSSQINEAKKDPRQAVKEYLDKLPPEMVDKLNTRCAELLDKWGVEVDDTPIELMNQEMGDDRFLKFLRKTVPLVEPKPRDMGANTFVQHFFDPPFDLEQFIGKIARQKGIPFAQAEQEWSDANMAKTHVGRYAHMLADDAVNGRPPSKEGTNPKEIAVYTAIYDYAKNLVEGATDVESEVTLHASSAYVGGKFDLLMRKNGVWTLVDWKTNGEELDDIPNGKVGLDELTKNINNNSYNKYALQLNVYEWAAKDSGKIPKNAKVSKELHHFQYLEEGKPVRIRVVKVPDLQPLVQKMVERAIELGVVKRK